MARYRLVNSNFFIREGEKFKQIDGKKVKIEDFDFFLHKFKNRFYVISCGISGARISKVHKTPKQAIKFAKDLINQKGESLIKNRIDDKVGSFYLSPRYRFIVNPTRNVATRKN